MQLNFPSFSPCKDIQDQPVLKTSTARLAWMILTQKLTLAGRWFAIPTLIFAMYGAVSLTIQGYVVFCYLIAFWILAAFGMFFIRPRVRLQAFYAPRVCAGQTMPVDVEVEQLARTSQIELFVLPHKLPHWVDADPEEGVALPTLRRGQKTRARLGLRCNRRGIYTLKGFRVESGFPFGLLRSARVFNLPASLVVYPRFQRLGRMNLPVGMRHHPGGVLMAAALGESFEFIGDREYRDGDNIRDIDWRATARLNRPIVREYREEYFMRIAVVLDTQLPAKATDADKDAFERAVSVAASVGDYMARQDYLVDIFAAGPKLYHLTAGRSLAYLDQILDILAAVDAIPEEPFEKIEPELLQNLAQITTVVCVFLDWTESRRAFARKIASMGCGVRVLVVRDRKCTIAPETDADLVGGVPAISRELYESGLEVL
jgi:uncharacterized protein (DUF58 family)